MQEVRKLAVRIPFMLGTAFFLCSAGLHAEVLFPPNGAVWSYFKGRSEASSPDAAAWRLPGFNDSAWASGPAPFLYTTAPTEPPFWGTGPFTGTSLNDMLSTYTCVFFRRTFLLTGADAISELTFTAAIDDGFIVWINGTEVVRQNVPAGNVPFNGLALLSPVEPVPVQTFLITNRPELLFDGPNLIAVQAFNRSIDSSDFGFMAGLASASDDQPPVLTSITPPANAIVRRLTQIEVQFSEPVTGVGAADLLVNGQPATGLLALAPDRYQFTFNPPVPGQVSLDWAATHGIADAALNPFGGAGWTCVLDTNLTAGAAVITEFLAANQGPVVDEDGEASDWIEIHNPGQDSVALDGWFLTDKASTLTKWRFPATNLTANGYMLVFASSKNRATPGAPLHTSFKLNADGGYLALVRPDGQTIATQFGPGYPRQRSGIAFGNSMTLDPTPLVTLGSPARLWVPSNNALGLSWSGGAEPFNDDAWLRATNGVGYDLTTGTGAAPIAWWNFDDAGNPFLSRDVAGGNHHATNAGSTFTAPGLGHSGQPGDRAMNFGPVGNGAYVYVPDATTGLFDSCTAHNAITVSLWIFGDDSEPGNNSAFYGSGAPDGSGTRVLNAHLPWGDSVIYWDTGGYNPDMRVQVAEPDPAQYRGRWNHYIFLKNGGTKQIWQNGVKILDQANTYPLQTLRGFVIGSGANLSAWSYGGWIDDFAFWDVALTPAQIANLAAGASPVSLDSLSSIISTDVSGVLRGRNPSAFVRVPFLVTAPIAFDVLLLRMRYEDGFVCWLNGVEVSRRNAPGTPAFDSAATVDRSKSAARTVEEFDLSSFIGLLRPGTNILAFQAMNRTAADSEFLLLPELLTGRSAAQLFFTTPTPGAANGGGVLGFTSDTAFTVDRGFYFQPTNTTISCATPGATLVYTLDGTEPTLANGIQAPAPNPATTPAVTVPITTTTLLRAAAFRNGYQPSDVDTHTYIFPANVALQTRPGWVPATWPDGTPADFAVDSRVVSGAVAGYSFTNGLVSIPTVSVVTSSNGLFSAANGIYANAFGTGPTWERPASAELIFPDGREGFHIRCGVRMHGGSSRDNRFTGKHSFSLLFQSQYGASKLQFPLFTNSPVDEFDQLILRGCSTDSWPVIYGTSQNGEPWPRWTRDEASYMRDQWIRDAQNDMGHLSAHGLYVHLYLDGLYWGLYNLAERPDDSFAAAYLGGRRAEYDVISDVTDLHAGTFDAWNQLLNTAALGLSSDAAVLRLQGLNPDGTRNPGIPVMLDLTNLIDYMILHIFGGADDWPDHNWWVSRRNAPDSAGFRFFAWDQELTNNSTQRQHISHPPYPIYAEVSRAGSPAALYAALRQNAEFRVTFGDRVHKHLFNTGQLSAATNIARWRARHDEIDRAIVAESARWGDYQRSTPPYRREVEWVSNQNWMVTGYFPAITQIALARFRNAGLYPALHAPIFSQFGGNVPAGFALTIIHTNPPSSIYVTLDGSDPRLPGGAVSPRAQLVSGTIPLTSPTLVRARVWNAGAWSALAEAQFHTPQDFTKFQPSEIMYNPPMFGTNDGDEVEFIELHNSGAATLDLSGLTFTAGITFTFTNDTLLPPGGYCVLARNPAVFAARYPGAPLHGLYTGRLENGGETLTLSHPLGGVLFTLHYDNDSPWPSEAENTGLSLQRMNTNPDAGNALNWIAAAPTPGGPLPPDLRDSDGDGMPDGWELAHGLDPGVPDAAADPDQDGMTNRDEFLAGTNPQDESDRLRLTAQGLLLTGDSRAALLRFQALAGKSYTLQWRESLATGGWSNLVGVAAQPASRSISVTNFLPANGASRFYRVTTPRLP